ncbi:MAG: hypothetical protein WA906_09520 [Pacificimonas sp.]
MLKAARPFLFALAPLIVGLIVYSVYWRAEAANFADVVASVGEPDVSGFPYRLNAPLPGIDVTRGGEGARIELTAGRSEIGRTPFQAYPLVGYLTDVEIDAEVAGFADARLTAPDARASLRASNIIQRLSMGFERASLSARGLPSATAAPLELHFRETPVTAPAGGADATPPAQAEARIGGTFDVDDLRFAASIPFKITADEPLASLVAWTDGGTIEIDGATITSPDDEPLAGFDATIAPLPDGTLALSGRLDTDCPLTITAMLGQGRYPAEEFRRRHPARFTLGGTPTAPTLSEIRTPSGGLARNREPPCPDPRR